MKTHYQMVATVIVVMLTMINTYIPLLLIEMIPPLCCNKQLGANVRRRYQVVESYKHREAPNQPAQQPAIWSETTLSLKLFMNDWQHTNNVGPNYSLPHNSAPYSLYDLYVQSCTVQVIVSAEFHGGSTITSCIAQFICFALRNCHYHSNIWMRNSSGGKK